MSSIKTLVSLQTFIFDKKSNSISLQSQEEFTFDIVFISSLQASSIFSFYLQLPSGLTGGLHQAYLTKIVFQNNSFWYAMVLWFLSMSCIMYIVQLLLETMRMARSVTVSSISCIRKENKYHSQCKFSSPCFSSIFLSIILQDNTERAIK